MGWKGTIRAIETEVRRSARESERRQKLQAKQDALQDAEETVNAFEDYIGQITSTHSEVLSDFIDWDSIANKKPPKEPKRKNDNELKAKSKYDGFKPNLLHKIMKSEDKKKEKLRLSIDAAISKDTAIYENAIAQYNLKFSKWESQNKLATSILKREPTSYLEVIKSYTPFASIENLGTSVSFSIEDNGEITASLRVNSQEVIPNEKYSLRQSGTLSTKNMPKGEFNELYQDHVCSSVLRVAGELFALLPIESIIVNANDELLNSKTGHLEEQTILSVLIIKATFEKLSLSSIDPSDSMDNFLHNMKFKKTAGFSPIEKVKFESVKEIT